MVATLMGKFDQARYEMFMSTGLCTEKEARLYASRPEGYRYGEGEGRLNGCAWMFLLCVGLPAVLAVVFVFPPSALLFFLALIAWRKAEERGDG